MKTLYQSRTGILLVAIISLTVFLGSCVPQKKYRLFQTKIKNDTTTTFTLKERPKSTIQPFDNLYVRVISPDEITSQMFNTETTNVQVVNYNMLSYTVNDSGYIDFPFAGLIKLDGLNLIEAKGEIQSKLSEYINEVAVIVKFVGKSVTVIGEVTNQGEYVIYSDNVNIFKAVSLADGFTEYADKKNVTIIRENDGKARFKTLDLTDRYLIQSDYYYLKPDDIIIVQPLKHKSFGFTTFPYTLVISSLTTIIAMLTFMRTF